ncbi:MupG family TIM beta-alpha barrel fold protein [Streptococcus iniae]|nr:MupG family TIM beta-alpha barrel fold protein [Streptococcus iniae]
MVTLGFSLYPEQHSLEDSKAYMRLLHKYGAKRLFMSFLQLSPTDQSVFSLYRELVAYANRLGIKVIADISPEFLEQTGWKTSLIKNAHDFGLAGVRLDEALPLNEMIALSNNPYGIKIELNMSTDDKLLTALLHGRANRENIIGCHNFYPHEFTGLSLEHFKKMSQCYHDMGIETATFISAQSATEGPWPLSEGLPTVEDYRHLPLNLQVEMMKALGTIDNLLLSNQFISEEELKECSIAVSRKDMTLKIKPLVELTDVEKNIIDFEHVYRGDISSYVVRSTMPRLAYADESIATRDQSKVVKRGSIIIDNDAYKRYKGELQIALKSFTISPKANLVAEIDQAYLPLLDQLKPWQSFRLER